MPIPNYKNRKAEEIINTKDLDDSAAQILLSLSWCDYAYRQSAPLTLHYAAFHLRSGVEQLWSEVLFAAKGASMFREEYRKALKNVTTLYKLIDTQSPNYKKYAEFVQIMASVDSRRYPPTAIWNISRLKRIHGECGGLLLHFQGVSSEGYMSKRWVEERLKFVYESAQWIAETMNAEGNLAVYFPDGLKKPEVFSIWERFRDGKNDAEDVRNGLKIIQPIVKGRPAPPRPQRQ